MKTFNKFLTVSAIVASIALPLTAFAGSISLAPASDTHTVGTSYTVGVYADPQGSKAYTAKVEVDFPASLVQVTSFTPASGTIPLVQTGYDLTDNTNGKLIKTVGLSGGITSSTLVGTITFYASSAGTASVVIASANSQLLDANNQNIATAFGNASYTLSAPVVEQAPVNAPAVTKAKLAASVSSSTAVVSTSTANTNVAAVAASGAGSHLSTWLIVLVILILVILAIWYGMKKKNKGIRVK